MSRESQSQQSSDKIVLLGKSCRIGDPRGVANVANLLINGTKDVQTICTLVSNDLSRNKREIEYILSLFELLKLVSISNDVISCEKILLENHLNDNDFLDWFTDRLIEFIMDNEIINVDAITFDFVTDTFLLSPTCISPKNSGFRNILIEFGVIARRTDSRYTILQKLDSYISHPEQIKKLTEKQLYAQLQKKKELGNDGETWALEYEKRRITKPSLNKRIKRISVIDVGAGYDIVSFENNDSKNFDRFIEVKTYKGKPHFHWSHNEIAKASVMGDKYFIYLVDADLLNCDDYDDVVQIIKNPIETIAKSSDWAKTPDSYFVEPIDDCALRDKVPLFANVINPDWDVKLRQYPPPQIGLTIRADNVNVLPNENRENLPCKTNEMDNLSSFEDAFPEDRERPARMRVWESLRKAGLLDAEYHLAEGVTRAEAKYMAQQIWEKRSPGQKVKWGQFDALWPNCEAKTKLRNESSTLDKEKKQRIDDLIRNS